MATERGRTPQVDKLAVPDVLNALDVNRQAYVLPGPIALGKVRPNALEEKRKATKVNHCSASISNRGCQPRQ